MAKSRKLTLRNTVLIVLGAISAWCLLLRIYVANVDHPIGIPYKVNVYEWDCVKVLSPGGYGYLESLLEEERYQSNRISKITPAHPEYDSLNAELLKIRNDIEQEKKVLLEIDAKNKEKFRKKRPELK